MGKIDDLERLQELRRNETLTEEEFLREKEKILNESLINTNTKNNNVCSKCGNIILEGEKFCGKCGNPINESLKNSQNKNDSDKNKKKNKFGILIFVIIIVIIGIIIGANFLVTNKAKNMGKNVKYYEQFDKNDEAVNNENAENKETQQKNEAEERKNVKLTAEAYARSKMGNSYNYAASVSGPNSNGVYSVGVTVSSSYGGYTNVVGSYRMQVKNNVVIYATYIQ